MPRLLLTSEGTPGGGAAPACRGRGHAQAGLKCRPRQFKGVHGYTKLCRDVAPMKRRPMRPKPPCPNCGKAIEDGRADKRFCDDDCRKNYHRGGKLNRAKLRAIVKRMVAEERRDLPALVNQMVASELAKHGIVIP